MKRVLMVCLGNICRSPLAQGILEKKAADYNLDVLVDSAGTSSYHSGERPDQRSAENALTHGVDLSHQTSRQFVPADFDAFDHIYAMDSSNYNDIIAQARTAEDKEKVFMILNVSNPGSNMSVPDPYFGGDLGFENVYQLLDEACEKIAQDILHARQQS